MGGFSEHLILLIIVCKVTSIFASCPTDPVADTLSGKIRGVKESNADGDEFCSFKGIPYAKPPIKDLRFRDPHPVEPWTGIRETTDYGSDCAQVNTLNNAISGVEDCLYLNVYTKSLGSKDLRPVMFFIHGGFFLWGSSDRTVYGPDWFMRKDVVLVSTNYRVGLFGFLNMDDELATGNQGLKDQQMALQWVHDNIAHFGGDPNSVTIFGQSAGAASTHYHTLSPVSRNLFHRAISESGVVLISWAFQDNPKEGGFELCENLGHASKDPKAAVEFLKTLDTKKLMKAQKQLLTKDEKLKLTLRFGPSIDSKSKNPMVPVHPEILAAAGVQMPLMLGFTNREGIILYKNVVTTYDRFNKEFNALMHPNIVNRMTKYGLTLDDLKRIYFPGGTVNKETFDQLIDLLGDMSFTEGIHDAVKIQVEKSPFPTYLYMFTYDKEPSFLKIFLNCPLKGACHADELLFLFKADLLEGKKKWPEKGSEEYILTEQMIDMWVNFATTGVPLPKPSNLIPFTWTPVDNRTHFHCLNICENLHMEILPSLEVKYTAK